MGVAFGVKCSKCGFEAEVYDDDGGIYDYYTYECFDCRDYFVISTEHVDEATPLLDNKPDGMPLMDYLQGAIIKNFRKNPTVDVKCKHCNGRNIKRLSYFRNGRWKADDLEKPCPKCKTVLSIVSEAWFDD